MQTLFDPTISYLVICSTDIQAHNYKNVYTRIFNVALFVAARLVAMQESKAVKKKKKSDLSDILHSARKIHECCLWSKNYGHCGSLGSLRLPVPAHFCSHQLRYSLTNNQVHLLSNPIMFISLFF